jgi:hypothetical protein
VLAVEEAHPAIQEHWPLIKEEVEVMITSASYRAFSGTLISAVLLLSLSSLALADTWDSIADADFYGGWQYSGAKLAVAEVMFLEGDSLQEESTLLIAITDGLDAVRLYSFDTGDSTLTLEDEVNVEVDSIDDPIAWSPIFMNLDVTGEGEESCLVIPTMADGTDGGSISIVRLTERDQDSLLVVIDNCFKCDNGDHENVYYVAELPPSAVWDYAISTEFANPLQHVILLASFDSDSGRFDDDSTFTVPYLYYGARHAAPEARPWVTAVQRFRYGSEFDGPLCYTTCHNGGVLIWDPADSTATTVSRIAASQHGGWYYDDDTKGELGDVHRAVVLEGGSSTFSDLDTIQVDSRLIFFSNRTMGFIVCDVSKPDAPQFVWQWDCDTRPCEENTPGPDWDWHGAGDVDDDAISQAAMGSFPGETFGIGVASNSSDDPPTIHVYLAGGVDGLRLFDLSEFLDPFGEDTTGESNFDDFSIDIYDNYLVGVFKMQAFDLQTFSEGGDTYVFTSWRKNRAEEFGPIGLTVHLDEDVVCD